MANYQLKERTMTIHVKSRLSQGRVMQTAIPGKKKNR